ncbi:MAG: glycoside hydrolase family 2 TIM barrel-domain containing protein [Angelakisella sp.]
MNSYMPDYPRPQLARSEESWQNLNGRWSFAFDDNKQGLSKEWYKQLCATQEIIVPFTYETKASGIGDETVHERVWYSRNIDVPADKLENGLVMLHFEGCDYQTTLWVNGVHVGEHTGGYARFSFDITRFVAVGNNTVTVMVDDSLDEQQPRGKQRWRNQNFGCWYVQTTGIWKTVWLEYLPVSNIATLKLTPNLPEATIELACDIVAENYSKDLQLEATVTFCGRYINSVTLPVVRKNLQTSISVYNTDGFEWGTHTWTPSNPNLYDIELKLIDHGKTMDTVLSYFGMREIRIEGNTILLNGHPLYQRLILDQGYWNDSHLTPPSEAALIEDIDKIKLLGYNGLRKHQKTEDERFLYWCDVKGMLVWSEMAAAYHFSDYAVDTFMKQWSEIVNQNYNHPCIITWTPINESWGVRDIKTDRTQQHFTEAVYHLTKSLDAHRPVIVNDGWEHTISDIITLHDYEEKGSVLLERYTTYKDDILENKLCHNNEKTAFAQGYSYRGQPIIISEFGGIAYNNDDNGWGYGNKVNTEEQFVARFDAITTAIKMIPYCCGYCYTQVTDVQQEINGLMDIERNFKVTPDVIHEINTRVVSCKYRL